MEKSAYEQLMEEVRLCQERSKKTLQNVDSTLLGVRQTLKDIQETNSNIDKIKSEYNIVMQKLCQKIAKSFSITNEPFKKREDVAYQHLPVEIPENQLIQKMIKHKEILIITGAGVSADSGIPTFRGRNGLYTNGFISEGKSYTPEEFITYKMFEQNPEGIWNWIDSIYSLSVSSKPNKIHYEIDILAKKLTKIGIKVILATQNIDNLHIKPLANEYQYYNIHGNCKQVRCDNHHFHSYDPNRKMQKCTICGKKIRPHILFFDESYGQDYGQEIKDVRFPFVICIGSSVKTGLAIKKIEQAQEVVEINPEPVLEIGKVYKYTNKTEDVLKKINLSLEEVINRPQKQKQNFSWIQAEIQ